MKHPEPVENLLRQTEKGGRISEFSKTRLAFKNNNLSKAERSKVIVYGNFGEILTQENNRQPPSSESMRDQGYRSAS